MHKVEDATGEETAVLSSRRDIRGTVVRVRVLCQHRNQEGSVLRLWGVASGLSGRVLVMCGN